MRQFCKGNVGVDLEILTTQLLRFLIFYIKGCVRQKMMKLVTQKQGLNWRFGAKVFNKRSKMFTLFNCFVSMYQLLLHNIEGTEKMWSLQEFVSLGCK